MRVTLRMVCVGLLGLAAALLVACGDTNGLLRASDADALKQDLDDVATAVEAGDCLGAGRALQRARSDFAALPSDVDPGLRRKLGQGLRHVAGLVPEECRAAQTETTTTETTTTETTTTETTPTETTTTTPTETTPPPTETTTTPTTPTTTTPPDSGGGQQAPTTP